MPFRGKKVASTHAALIDCTAAGGGTGPIVGTALPSAVIRGHRKTRSLGAGATFFGMFRQSSDMQGHALHYNTGENIEPPWNITTIGNVGSGVDGGGDGTGAGLHGRGSGDGSVIGGANNNWAPFGSRDNVSSSKEEQNLPSPVGKVSAASCVCVKDIFWRVDSGDIHGGLDKRRAWRREDEEEEEDREKKNGGGVGLRED